MEEMMDAAKLTESELQRYRSRLWDRMKDFDQYHNHYRWLQTLLTMSDIGASITLKIPDTEKVVSFDQLFLIGLPGMIPSDDRFAAKREVAALLKANIEASVRSLELLLIDSLFAHERIVV